jgi:hypothetical protein
MFFARLSVVFALFWASAAHSHEFWIEPTQYQVESGAPIEAHLRNGENFKGVSLGWFDRRFTRFDMVSGDTVMPVAGRMGDTPALQATAPHDGLLIVLHETTEQRLTYRKWEKFLRFVDHKDFAQAVETHEANGWPKEDFREVYTRHVKSLIAVGSGDGSDRAFGLKTEFVALSNPYSDDFNGEMRVLLTYQGTPRADAQVEVFARAPDGTVDVTLHRTNAQGQATVPVLAGYEYLFDAVVLLPSARAGTEENAPVWESYWAGLTFAVPAGN